MPEALRHIAGAAAVNAGVALVRNHNSGDFEDEPPSAKPRSASFGASSRTSAWSTSPAAAPHLRRGLRPPASRACSRRPRRTASTGSLVAPLEAQGRPARRRVPALPPRASSYPQSLLPTLDLAVRPGRARGRNIQYNEELARKNDELTHLDQLKSDFMATMSHELRTPLTSVIGYSDMMLGGMTGELNEQQTHLRREHPAEQRDAPRT